MSQRTITAPQEIMDQAERFGIDPVLLIERALARVADDLSEHTSLIVKVGNRFDIYEAENDSWCMLIDCPPGLFVFDECLGFKSEYGARNAETMEVFCVNSGEVFWGGTCTMKERAALMVQPVSIKWKARS